MKKIIKFFKKYLPLLGLILFVVILSTIDLEKIWRSIKSIDLLYLIIAILMAFPILLNKAICWNYIKKQQGIKYSLKNSTIMYCSSFYLGFITPGRIGELTKALYLKKDGHSLGKSLVNVVLDRLSDLGFLLIIIFLGSLLFLNFFSKQIWISLIIILLSCLIVAIFLKVGLLKLFLKKIFYISVPRRYQKSWKINFQDFVQNLKTYKFKNYLIIFIITAFSWLFYYLQMYFLAQGTNIEIPFLYLAVSVTITGLITLIPVSISGIGTRDAALILLFSPFLIPKEQIIVFSALILLMSLFAALVGFICYLIKPLRLSTD